MRKNQLLLAALTGCIAFCTALNVTVAKDDKFEPVKIGVVSMKRVFENNKKNLSWNEEMDQQRETLLAELRKMQSQIEADSADMATRKKGSKDYLDLRTQVVEKRAMLEARQKLYEQQLLEKEKDWTEKLYLEILEVIKRVAQDKGLDMVIAKEEFKFPSESTNELLLTIKTSKVLYHGEELDITNDVLAAVDGEYF